MRTKDEIVSNLTDCLEGAGSLQVIFQLTSLALLEVLLDIRDTLVTDCRDAMNALIEIRKQH